MNVDILWGELKQKRVALLTNFVAPYRVPLLRLLQTRMAHLKILVSTKMEKDRDWSVDLSELDVEMQKCLSYKKNWNHPNGFKMHSEVHIPMDTISILRHYKPDLIISGELGFRTFFSVLYKKLFHREVKLLGWATINWVSEQGRGKLRILLRRWILKNLDGILVNGHSGKEYLIQMGMSPERVFIVHQGVDTALFQSRVQEEREFHSDKLTFAMTGQLIERKGIKEGIDLLSQYCKQNPNTQVTLKLIGNGPLGPSIRKLSVPSNLHLEFTGSVGYEQVPIALENADALFFPTLCDEWGLVVNEAMAAGLPVLGSIYSGAVETMITDDRNGWKFDPMDIGSGLRSLRALANKSQSEYAGMQENARETASAYDVKEVAKRCLHGISRVLH